MSTQDAYEEYYVPHDSKLPIFASLGMFLTLFGMGNMFNEMTAGTDSSFGEIVFLLGGLVMGGTLLIAITYSIANLVVVIVYAFLHPKIRYG